MPKYRFNLLDGVTLRDPTGTVLANDDAALAEGAQVARELKSNNTKLAHEWSVEIKDGNRVVADIPFNSVD